MSILEKTRDSVNADQLASAGPAERARVLSALRAPLQDGVREQIGRILEIAPTYHVLSFQPQVGHEEKVKEILKQSIEWLERREGVYAATLYEVVQATHQRDLPTKFMLTLSCDNKKVMEGLLQDETGRELANILRGSCIGKSATEAGEFGVNSLLLGLV